MRILMIAPNFPPNANAEAIVNGKIAKALLRRGAFVTVITTSKNCLAQKIDNSTCWCSGLGEVIHLPVRINNASALVLGKIGIIFPDTDPVKQQAYKVGKTLLEISNYDAIISPSGGLFAAYRLKTQFNIKWIVSINDPFPVVLNPPPYNYRYKILYLYSIFLTKAALRAADTVIFPSQRLSVYLENMLKIELGPRKVVLPHIGWKGQSNRQVKVNDYINIVHAGPLTSHRGCTLFFRWFNEVIAHYRELKDRVKVSILGTRKENGRVMITKESLGYNFHISDLVSYQDSLNIIANADSTLLIEANMAEGIYLPSKFADYAVSEKPILMYSPENGTISDMVKGYRHPGFLGQGELSCKKQLKQYFDAILSDGDLSRYKYERPYLFESDRIAEQIIGLI